MSSDAVESRTWGPLERQWPSLRRLRVGSAIAIAVIAINAAVTFADLWEIRDDWRALSSSFEAASALDGLLARLTDAETGQRGFLLTREESYLEPYHRARSALNDSLARLGMIAEADPATHQRVAEVGATAISKLAELEETLRLEQARGADAAIALVKSGRGKALMETLRRQVAVIHAQEDSRRRRLEREMRQAIAWTINLFAATSTLALILLMAVHRLDRRSREQLGRHARWFSTTLQSIGDAVIATDDAGCISFMNRAAEVLTGWSGIEAKRKPIEEVFRISNEATGVVVENPVAEVLRRETVVGLANHTVLTSKEGDRRPIDDSAAPIRGDDGVIQGVVMVFHDVTERRDAERQLRESEERLRVAVRAAPMVVYTCDRDLRYTWIANPIGMAAAEFLGKRDDQLLPADDVRELIDIKRRVVDRGRGERKEIKLTLRGSDLVYDLTCEPLRDEAGRIVGAIVAAMDVTDRALLFEQLRQSEARFSAVVNHSPAYIFAKDREGRYILANEALARLVGTDPGRFIGKTDADFFPAAVAAKFHDDDTRILENAEVRIYRESFAHRGATLTSLTVKFPLLDPDGKAYAACGIATDISDLIRAEEEWRKFAFLADNSYDFIGICDLQLAPNYVNREGMRLVGLESLDQLRGLPITEFFFPEDRPFITERFFPQVLREGHGEVEIRFRNQRTGEPIWMLYSVVLIRNDAGEPTGLATISRDITERMRGEEAVRNRSEQLRKLADIASRINVAQDMGSVLEVVTEEARLLLGAHQSAAGLAADQDWARAMFAVSLSKEADGLGSSRERPAGLGPCLADRLSRTPIRLTRAELEAEPGLAILRGVGDQHAPLQGILAVPLFGRAGRPIGVIQLSDRIQGEFTADDEAILVQLAQLASVAIENARLYQQLRDTDRRKDEFLATLAHELRNPLAPIRNALQVIRLADGKAAVVETARSMMERQVNQMVRLIDDLLDISRITRGKLELRRQPVELATVVQDAVETSRPLIERARHALSVELPAEPIPLDADLTRLAQVFANLLNNSAKYTEEGGRISLTAKRSDGEVIVAVKDSGVGIPREMLPHVFELFTQVDRSLEKSQGGLGIGLTLVKSLVELHGGSVEARSEGPGRGSEFLVRLPTAGEPESAATAGTVAQPGRPKGSLRILIADDNLDSASSMGSLLEIMGHEVRLAHDGLEAVEVASGFRPDVVLMDIGMPRQNGYDAARSIRAQPWAGSTVLIALTGWGQLDDKARAREAGFDYHLTKPADPEELQTLLGDLARREGGPAPASAARDGLA